MTVCEFFLSVGASLLAAAIVSLVAYLFKARVGSAMAKILAFGRERRLKAFIARNPYWTLVYNRVPKNNQKDRKDISFEKDGTIGGDNEGRYNENKWRIEGNHIVILNSDGKEFSRFYWSEYNDSQILDGTRTLNGPEHLKTPYLVRKMATKASAYDPNH